MRKIAVLQGLTFAASLCIALPALSQDSGTLKKIKDSGTATMGVRESSGGLSAVKTYADNNFYLHFQDYNKQIEVGVGFWVNRP